MCGIVGYVGPRAAAPLLYKGLKKLEYRGYDSAGIATIHPSSPLVLVKKGVGRVDDIHQEVDLKGLPGNIGIGHTRWATHGGVTVENAHPHTSSCGRIAVVHNGIIENYNELRKMLSSLGYSFYSETDTEVVAKLIEHYISQGYNLVEACKKAKNDLEGSYALVVASTLEPSRLVALRRESPLVVGVGDRECFVASDATPFLDHTNTAIFLEDGDLAIVGPGTVTITNGSGTVTRPYTTIEWTASEASKEGYPHYMLKEVMEQPVTTKKALYQDATDLEEIASRIREANRVYLVGAGTSFHASLVAKYLFADAGIKAHAVLASEFEHFACHIEDEDVVIAISQSGETADVLHALSTIETNPYLVAIVNVVGSSLARMAEKVLYINAGPEIGVASTKAYTGQLVVLSSLYHYVKGDYPQARKRMEKELSLLSKWMDHWDSKTREIATLLSGTRDFYFIGRGLDYPTAAEGALKLKEISYIHAEGFAGGELKHGTLALIEEGVPCVCIAPDSPRAPKTISNAIEIKSRGGKIIGVSEEKHECFDYHITIPHTSMPHVFSVIPLQLLAYHVAVARGLDPDKPRNLAKSVTVK